MDDPATLEALEARVQATSASESDQKDALRALLKTYPLLYGYWLRLTALDPAAWPEAVTACPCVQLWTAYIDYSDSLDICKEAVDSIGRDFHADPLWERYLHRLPSEGSEESSRKLVLERVTKIPLFEYAKYAQISQTEVPDLPQEVYEDTAQAVAERWEFERRIERFYFHVLPVPENELQAWDEYLDYEEMQGNTDQITMLYTRCLIVTALYPGFWLKYLRWLSLDGSVTDIEAIFEKALHYNPGNPRLIRYRAQLRELRDELTGAREDYAELGPDELRWFERRQGNDTIESPRKDPMIAFRAGTHPDLAALASQLRSEGRLEEFFEVDAKLE